MRFTCCMQDRLTEGIKMVKQFIKWTSLVLVISVMLGGCAGKPTHMQVVPNEEASFAPTQDEALIVFMRPATMGFAIQSSVFEIIDDKPELVGLVAAKKKTAYMLKPGKHLFMVVGESADFMEANVEAGKVYLSVVTPRMGAWKARFSLDPVQKSEYDAKPEAFKKWLDSCEWVVNTPDAHKWAQENYPSISKKHTKYYKVWKDKEEKPIMVEEDGLEIGVSK